MRAWLLLPFVVACFAPTPATGVACGTDGACPAPLVCAPATNTCEKSRGTEPDATTGVPVDSAACVPASMHDEDRDGIADSCDNCPSVANASQADTTEDTPDGVGDACDPRPAMRDRIALFESFAAVPAGWQIDAQAVVEDDRIEQAPSQGYGEAYATLVSTRGVVETRYTVTAIVPDAPYASVEVVAEKGPSGVEGYRCLSGQGTGTGRGIQIQTYTAPFDVAGGTAGAQRFVVGDSGVLRLAYGSALACTGTDPADTVTAAEPEARTGVVGLATQYVGAAFDYLVVYEPAE